MTWGGYLVCGLTIAATRPVLHLPNYLSEWHVNRLAVLRTLRGMLS